MLSVPTTFNDKSLGEFLWAWWACSSHPDLIETFKILKGLESIPVNSLFELNTSTTRGNSLKLTKPRSSLNIRHNNFSQRVINGWNRLPEHAVASTTVNRFKNAIDRHFREIHEVSMTRSLNP